MEEKELNLTDFKMGDDVYRGENLLGKFICYSYSYSYKEVMVDVLIDSGIDKESNIGGWFAKDVSRTPQKPKRWRAKEGRGYYFIAEDFKPREDREYNTSVDNKRYDIGNYFRTHAEAQQAAEEVRKTIEKFHNRKEGEK